MDTIFSRGAPGQGGATKGAPSPVLGTKGRRNDLLADWLATCPKMDATSFMRACFGKGALPAAPWATQDHPLTLRDIVQILCVLGKFEPRGISKPTACDIVTIFDKTVEVPPATIDGNGKIVPSFEKLIRFCAPSHRSLVVDQLRALPANLTATENGEVFSKTQQVMGFSEAFCPAGEAGDGDGLGTFQMAEHVVLCPEAGFDLHARNHDPFSPALFHVFAKSWATC